MNIVNIYNAKTNLSGLIEQAIAGEDVVIAKFNKPLVKLTPIDQSVTPRKFGALKGKILIGKDFNAVDGVISNLFYVEE